MAATSAFQLGIPFITACRTRIVTSSIGLRCAHYVNECEEEEVLPASGLDQQLLEIELSRYIVSDPLMVRAEISTQAQALY
jgi:hypothetical protein